MKTVEAKRHYDAIRYAKSTTHGLDIDRAMRLYAEMVRRGYTKESARQGVYMATRDGLLGYIQNKQ